MKRFAIIFLALMLVAGPVMPHHAVGAVDSDSASGMSGVMIGHSIQDANAADHHSDYDDETGARACCSQAVVNCETASTSANLQEYFVARSTEDVSFVVRDFPWARFMPERETPPPRA